MEINNVNSTSFGMAFRKPTLVRLENKSIEELPLEAMEIIEKALFNSQNSKVTHRGLKRIIDRQNNNFRYDIKMIADKKNPKQSLVQVVDTDDQKVLSEYDLDYVTDKLYRPSNKFNKKKPLIPEIFRYISAKITNLYLDIFKPERSLPHAIQAADKRATELANKEAQVDKNINNLNEIF